MTPTSPQPSRIDHPEIVNATLNLVKIDPISRAALWATLSHDEQHTLMKTNPEVRDLVRHDPIRKIKKSNQETYKVVSEYPSGGYKKLSSTQKEIVDRISSQHPNAVKDISETVIIMETSEGVFELPLIDTELPAKYEHTRISQEFLDKKKELGLRENCKYYSGDSVMQYYDDTQQDFLKQEDVMSIIGLMPSGDTHTYEKEGKDMRKLMKLIGMTEQDLTSWGYSGGNAVVDSLAEYGCVWLGVENNGILLGSVLTSMGDELRGIAYDYVFRLRLFKKLSS